MERGRSTRSFVVLVTRCMYYGRPSGQTLNLCVKEHRKAVTSGLSGDTSSYVCNSRAHYAQQSSTILNYAHSGRHGIYIGAAPTSQRRERPSPSSLRYITRPHRLTTPLLTGMFACIVLQFFNRRVSRSIYIVHFQYCMCG